jgi:hypothetical protein
MGKMQYGKRTRQIQGDTPYQVMESMRVFRLFFIAEPELLATNSREAVFYFFSLILYSP